MRPLLLSALLCAGTSHGAPSASSSSESSSPALAALDRQISALEANSSDREAQRSVFSLAKKLAEAEKLPADIGRSRADAVEAAKTYLTAEQNKLERLQKELGKLLDMSSNIKDPLAILEASRQAQTISPLIEDPGIESYVNTIYGRLGAALSQGLFTDKKLLHEAMGYLRFHDRDWDAAQREWSTALKSGDGDSMLRGLARKARDNARREKNALRAFNLASKGKAYLASGQYEKAVAAFRALLAQQPGDPEAQRLLEESQRKFESQERDRQIAENLALGTAFQRQRKYLEASERFLKVIEADPSNQTAKEHLKEMVGMLAEVPGERRRPSSPVSADASIRAESDYQQGLLLYIQGNKTGAKQSWRRALDLYPLHEKAKAALQRISAEESFTSSP